jgi:meiotic recombination protein SPO11
VFFFITVTFVFLSSMLGCMRDCLNVVASAKGLVVGRVNFRDDGDLIDCTRMGVGGKAIPPFMDKITDIQSDAKVTAICSGRSI